MHSRKENKQENNAKRDRRVEEKLKSEGPWQMLSLCTSRDKEKFKGMYHDRPAGIMERNEQ